ncbi:hypothetical protein JYT36_00880, partial [Bacteroidales bacterium AH-315-N07]|nr:hypothetical protein [Bacteroidales bacterium AH-315-N07]
VTVFYVISGVSTNFLLRKTTNIKIHDIELKNSVPISKLEGIREKNYVLNIGFTKELADRNVILIEDIVDSGNTIMQVFAQIKKYELVDLKVATLLFKPKAMQFDYKPDYICFEVENKFFVGYGLDYDGYGRNLDELYILK